MAGFNIENLDSNHLAPVHPLRKTEKEIDTHRVTERTLNFSDCPKHMNDFLQRKKIQKESPHQTMKLIFKLKENIALIKCVHFNEVYVYTWAEGI